MSTATASAPDTLRTYYPTNDTCQRFGEESERGSKLLNRVRTVNTFITKKLTISST